MKIIYILWLLTLNVFGFESIPINHALNVSGIENGIYYSTIGNEKNIQSTKKIVLSH